LIIVPKIQVIRTQNSKINAEIISHSFEEVHEFFNILDFYYEKVGYAKENVNV